MSRADQEDAERGAPPGEAINFGIIYGICGVRDLTARIAREEVPPTSRDIRALSSTRAYMERGTASSPQVGFPSRRCSGRKCLLYRIKGPRLGGVVQRAAAINAGRRASAANHTPSMIRMEERRREEALWQMLLQE